MQEGAQGPAHEAPHDEADDYGGTNLVEIKNLCLESTSFAGTPTWFG